MPSGIKINAVILDWYTSRQISNYNTDDNLCEIRLSGNQQNFYSRIDHFEKYLGESLHPLVQDFYKIAISVYVCDLHFKRDLTLPNRRIKILASVSDKSKWDANKSLLESVIYQLSGDTITFEFLQGKRSKADYEFEGSEDEVVSLFSGGLDSLAGTKTILDQGKNAILVSHSSPAKITAIQNTLYSKIDSHYSGRIDHLGINAIRKGKKLKNNENSRRMRSFLFLTLGGIIALQKGLKELYIFENGIMSLNIPIVTSRIFLNTKTTDPTYIKMYNQLLNEVFSSSIEIKNPFLTKTKSEVIQLFDTLFDSIIDESISCSKITPLIMKGVPISEIWHCGTCLPCILRRISINSLGKNALDVKYDKDVLTKSELTEIELNLVLELLSFARKLSSASNYEEVLHTYPSFYSNDFDPQISIEMYQRYASEILAFFSLSSDYVDLI